MTKSIDNFCHSYFARSPKPQENIHLRRAIRATYFTLVIPAALGLIWGASRATSALKNRVRRRIPTDDASTQRTNQVGNVTLHSFSSRQSSYATSSGSNYSLRDSDAVANGKLRDEPDVIPVKTLSPKKFTEKLIHAALTDVDRFITLCEEAFSHPELISKDHIFTEEFDDLLKDGIERKENYGYIKEIAVLHLMDAKLWEKIPREVIEEIPYSSWNIHSTFNPEVDRDRLIKEGCNPDVVDDFITIIYSHHHNLEYLKTNENIS